MTPGAVLELVIKAKDLAGAALKNVKDKIDDVNSAAQSAASKGLKALQGGFSKAVDITKGFLVGGLITATTAIGGMGIASLKSASEVESMGAALYTAMGRNKEAAEQAQATITKFASQTPYELGEVMTGFIKLKNMGLDPSQKALTAYGDTASAMGKGLNDMVEAVADAATGEFERLKEFGIRASSQGNQVAFTFQGVTTTVGKNSKEIEDYLIKLGQTKFAGGMKLQSETLSGMMSTMKDNINLSLAAIAKNTGLLDFAKSAVGAFNKMMESIDFEKLGQQITDSINKVRDTVQPFIQWLQDNPEKAKAALVGLAVAISTIVVVALGQMAIAMLATAAPIIAIAALIGGLYYLFQTNDAVRDFVLNVWSKLQYAFEYFQQNVMPKVLEVVKMLADYWQNNLAPALLEAWQNIQPALNALGELVQRVFGFIVGYIQNFLLPALGILVGMFLFILPPAIKFLSATLGIIVEVLVWIVMRAMDLVGMFKNMIVNSFNTTVAFIKGAMDLFKRYIIDPISDAVGFIRGIDLGKMGKDMMQGFINGVKDMAGKIIDAVTKPINDAKDKVKNLLGIRSPSRVFMKMGQQSAEGYAVGMEQMQNRVNNAASNMAEETVDVASTRSSGKSVNTPSAQAVDSRDQSKKIEVGTVIFNNNQEFEVFLNKLSLAL